MEVKDLNGTASQPRAILRAAPQQLDALIEFSGFASKRGFADEVARELRKDRKHPPMGCSHTTILNLTSGKAKRVHPRRAAAIEKALKQPRGQLFRLELFHVPGKGTTAA
jgi:hypothetical protein